MAKRVESFFRSALKVINPKILVEKSLEARPINGKVNLVGFGKGAAGMVSGVIESVGKENIHGGMVSVPVGTRDVMKRNDRLELWPDHSNIKIFEVARNNLPDSAAAEASRNILNFCTNLTNKDQLIVCASGGGSACLSLPAKGISVAEKHSIVKMIASRGATIEDLNRIRGRLSLTKSGRLLNAACPARVETLILSDIIGDPVHLIGSGPTIPFSENIDILKILRSYDIQLDKKVEKILIENEPPKLDVTPNYRLVGRNQIALDEIKRRAEESRIPCFILSDSVSGEAQLIGRAYAKIAKYLLNKTSRSEVEFALSVVNFPSDIMKKIDSIKNNNSGPCLLVSGGEPTVTLTGSGKGGRNQELALSFSEAATGIPEVTFLSGGTDGQDGPCDVAGAWVRSGDYIPGTRDALAQNDSYNLFDSVRPEQHIRTGLTFTNVMDLHIMFLERGPLSFSRSDKMMH